MPEAIVHIGSGKTGTSSIQRTCARNRGLLAAEGVLYPESPGSPRHTEIGMICRPDEGLVRTVYWQRMGETEPDVVRARVADALSAEIAAADPSRVLISDEGLYSLPRDGFERLRALLDRWASAVRVVVYLRRQDDHLISRYQQSVKVGETRRLAEFVDMDYRLGYDYRERLRQVTESLRPDELVVRPFESSRFVDGSLFADFLTASALTTRLGRFRLPKVRNESIDATCVEFLRLVNLAQSELHGRPDADNRPIVRAVRELSSGPVLTLPAATLDAFMGRWTESNDAVARDHLGEAHLFRESRRTSGTTTLQRFDPALLEEFLERTYLDAELGLRLREIAAREAS